LDVESQPHNFSSVHVLAVSDFDDAHNKNVVSDFVEHPVDAASEPVLLRSGELSGLWRPWIVGQGSNGRHDPLDIPLGNGIEILWNRTTGLFARL
jgi:hypothetical protein